MTQSLDLRAARARATAGSTPPVIEKESDVPLVRREAQLPFVYHAPDGSTHNDVLTSRVLAFDTKAAVARMEADLCGGRTFEAMSAESQAWIRKVAYVTFHLVDVPQWVADWTPLDQELLDQLYLQCQAHDYLFFRSGPAQGEGAPTRSRVVVDSPLVAQATALRKREVTK